MKHTDKSQPTGQQLVADFQSIFLTLATTRAALHEAERSESAVLQQLSAVSRGSYLNPSALSNTEGDYAAHASLDAHIKKVQAEQMQSLSTMQVGAVIAEDRKQYIGRKVSISSLDAKFKPFDGVWFDSKFGLRSNELKKSHLEGVIEDINFEKNVLVITPKRFAKLVNTSLQGYLVYVINPETLQPAVEITVC